MKAHVDLNHSTIQELERAFHSRERANQILNKREILGDFKSWADVREKVPGFGEDTVQSLREAGVTVSPEGRLTGARRTRRGRIGSRHLD
jgi:DNA uptake protein ComE-like DNA-binding protein